MQYLTILLSSFGEEDFQRFASNFLSSNCLWLLFLRQNRWQHHLNKLELHIHKDYLCVIYKIFKGLHQKVCICRQYLRILLSSFGEEDFQRFASNFLFKLSLAIISPKM